ncbi:MAG: sigma-70 family RNA polymerase sigma factor [Acidimicrobiia bacterium]
MSLPPFQRLLDQHSEAVYRFLVASVGPHDADDCFQETFLSAMRAYPRLRNDENLRGWILTVAHRKALDHHRSSARRHGRRQLLAAMPSNRGAADDDASDHDDELWETVGALPPKQRDAVVHRYVNDLTYRRIGELTGCTEVAARRNCHEGVKKLRKELAP